MKPYRMVAFVAATLLSLGASAQHSKVTTAWSYLQSKDFDKARDAINLATQNDDTKNDAKTWFYRGEAYQGIYATTEKTLKENMEKNKDTASLHAYSNYLCNNLDLKEAAASYRKTMTLDDRKNFPEAGDYLVQMTLLLYNDANQAYNNGKYAASLDKFQDFQLAYAALGDKKAKIDNLFANLNPPMDKREITLLMAGAELQLKQRDEAKKLLQELADSKFYNPVVYQNLAKMYLHDNDTVKSLAALDQGIAAVPDSVKAPILIDKLNIYMSQGKAKEAIDVAEAAIKKAPNNISLYVALANLYGRQKNYDKALDEFKQANTLKPNSFEVLSGSGLIKYNMGVDLFNKSIDAKKSTDQDKFLADAKSTWKDAIPDLNVAVNANHTSSEQRVLADCYDALSKIYFHLDDAENGKKFKALYDKTR